MIFLKKRLSVSSSESRSDSESEFHFPRYSIENGEPTPRRMNQDFTGKQGSHSQSNLDDPRRNTKPKSKRRFRQAFSFGGKKKTPLPNAELGLKRVGTDSNLLTTNKPSVFKKIHRRFFSLPSFSIESTSKRKGPLRKLKKIFSRSRSVDGSKSRPHTNGLPNGNGVVKKSPLDIVHFNVLQKHADQGLGTRSSNGVISPDRGQSDANTDPMTNNISNLNGLDKELVREDSSEISDSSNDFLTDLANALKEEKDKNQQLSRELENSQNQLNQSQETINQLEAKNKELEHQSIELFDLSGDLIEEYDSTRAENANFRAENANFRAENANLNESYRNAVFSNSDLAKRLQISEAEKDELTVDKDKLADENDKLADENKKLTAEKDNLNDTISSLEYQNQIWMNRLTEKAVNELYESMKSLETNGQAILNEQKNEDKDSSDFIQLLGIEHIQEDEKEQLDVENLSLQFELENSKNHILEQQKSLTHFREANEKLNHDKVLLEKSKEALEKSLTNTKLDLEIALQQSNNFLEQEKEEHATQLNALQQEKEERTIQLNALLQEKEEHTTQLSTLQQEKELLTSQLNASQQEKEGLATQLNASQQEKEGLAQQLNTLQQENKGPVGQLNDSKKVIGLHKRNKEKSTKLPKETRLKLRKQQNESKEDSVLSKNSLSQERKKEREERRRVHSQKVSSRLSNNPISPIQQPDAHSSSSSNILKRLRFPSSSPSPSGADQSLKFRVGGVTSNDVSELKQLLSQITNVEVEKLFIEKMSEVFRKNFTSFKKPHSLFYYILANYFKFKYKRTPDKRYLDMINKILQYITDGSLNEYNISSKLDSLKELVKSHQPSKFDPTDLFSPDKPFLEKCVYVSSYTKKFDQGSSDAIFYLTRFDQQIYESFAANYQPFLNYHLGLFKDNNSDIYKKLRVSKN